MTRPRPTRLAGATTLVACLTLSLAGALAAPTGAADRVGADRSVADADAAVAEPEIALERWDSLRDFGTGTWRGTVAGADGAVVLAAGRLPRMRYDDPHRDGPAREYAYGSWTSPVVALDDGFGVGADEAITSWNARTPTGTWVETRFRGRHADGSWTRWYVLGRWTSGMTDADIARTSVPDQDDADGDVWTDTFAAAEDREVVAYQSRVRLLKPADTRRSPRLDAVATMASTVPYEARPTSAYTLDRRVEVHVPRFSQNIHRGEYPEYGGGGQVWCSPTSSSMVLYRWGARVAPAALADIEAPNGDPQVPYAAMRTWDHEYEGSGNWPFNAAYAATFGLDAFVTRMRSLQEVERFVARGIPVVISLGFDEDEMPEAGYGTNGHLMVVVGFTADGDPILNDPASSSNAAVRNVYTRENLERVWQQSSGGVVYVYTPERVDLPPTPEGLPANW